MAMTEMTRQAPGHRETAVGIFDEIRRFRYLSDGQRDPAVIAARRAGSCTGKHLLLRDRLRAAGYRADVETVRGDFAAGIPVHASMSAPLRRMLADAGVEDYHNYVRLDPGDGTTVRLDATWHDALRDYGFPVNDGWTGTGDTRIALEPRETLGVSEDVVAFKTACLTRLDRETLQRRARFLKLLSEWIAQAHDAAPTTAEGRESR